MVSWAFYIGSCQCDCIFRVQKEVVERFDRRDPEAPFMGLEKLKQSGNTKIYISKFLKLSIMVPNLSAARRVYMFIYGLE